MKTTVLSICFGWIACLVNCVFADDDKSDVELLDFARDRAQQVRVIPDPFQIYSRVALQCDAPTSDQLKTEASNPHYRAAVCVYANGGAVAPLWDPYEKFPIGSILLKEKFDDTNLEQPTLYTGMIKHDAGYFPDCGDWEFFTLDGHLTKVTSRGKLESCAACHREFAKYDYVSKEYAACPTHVMNAWINDEWRAKEGIASGTDNVFYLPASLAKTSGSKLGRAEAVQRWYQANIHRNDLGSLSAPEDLSEFGGPTLRYEPDETKNTLGYWTNVHDWASWKIDVRKPGSYEVSVLQGCGKGSGGAEVAVSVADQSLTFVVEDTGHFQNFKWREIGQVKIGAAGEYTLTVKSRSKPGAAVMDLRQIILRPTDARSEK